MPLFDRDEEGYAAWLLGNQDGFVLNLSQNPDPWHVRLHRAGCRTISGTPASGRTWTTRYGKACGTREEVDRWAADRALTVLSCWCVTDDDSDSVRPRPLNDGTSADRRTCPTCGSDLVPVVAGLPGPELWGAVERGEVVLGGCVVLPGDPEHRVGCSRCVRGQLAG